jgi:hypothetical protein
MAAWASVAVSAEVTSCSTPLARMWPTPLASPDGATGLRSELGRLPHGEHWLPPLGSKTATDRNDLRLHEQRPGGHKLVPLRE